MNIKVNFLFNVGDVAMKNHLNTVKGALGDAFNEVSLYARLIVQRRTLAKGDGPSVAKAVGQVVKEMGFRNLLLSTKTGENIMGEKVTQEMVDQNRTLLAKTNEWLKTQKDHLVRTAYKNRLILQADDIRRAQKFLDGGGVVKPKQVSVPKPNSH